VLHAIFLLLGNHTWPDGTHYNGFYKDDMRDGQGEFARLTIKTVPRKHGVCFGSPISSRLVLSRLILPFFIGCVFVVFAYFDRILIVFAIVGEHRWPTGEVYIGEWREDRRCVLACF
jgi:MORN repeat